MVLAAGVRRVGWAALNVSSPLTALKPTMMKCPECQPDSPGRLTFKNVLLFRDRPDERRWALLHGEVLLFRKYVVHDRKSHLLELQVSVTGEKVHSRPPFRKLTLLCATFEAMMVRLGL